ncbi:hypothetical protein HPB52_022546 [Rhipicephalus sanguineus]|uniref:UFSP1/2/DUB catalytic domain-containing protein n=1 Tax=Rhipicephalus sanguineus TaxID=34632 RepID=A0A9D4PG23_RHISA|nr:hypothetical protein HPB52_022546 [Rhipicephalus sanguineus]
MTALLEDIHEGLELPQRVRRAACVRGKYAYYHYGCDGLDDRGWGCGYRTLQTICSWVLFQKAGEEAKPVPSIAEIQAALVSLGDKEAHFEGSCDWIGSTEVFLCLDHFYQPAMPEELRRSCGLNCGVKFATFSFASGSSQSLK